MSLGDNFGDNLGITRYPLHYLQGGTALFAGGTASLAGGAAHFAGGTAFLAGGLCLLGITLGITWG